MHIPRDRYLKEILARRRNGFIKVVTGIRRSGKSYLLFKIFKQHLLGEGVSEDHIICIDLDNVENRHLRDITALLAFVKSQLKDQQHYYILLDEVQLVPHFEEILNSWVDQENLDVYVTGSNSKFLSKDIITEFRGRGDEIHIFPLSYREFMQVYPGDRYQGWTEYITYGGLPRVLSFSRPEQKSTYLKRLFQETYLQDIQARYHIKHLSEFNSLIDVLASAIGSLTNPHKLAATFKSKMQSKVSSNTLERYIAYLEDAFLLTKASRYDVKGRKYIGSPLKYYFEDVSLRNARLSFRQVEETHLMENVIFNELRARGFEVDVGVVPVRQSINGDLRQRTSYEIDFVANLGSRRYYIQSAWSMSSPEEINAEKASLRQVPDHFKKIIIVQDAMPLRRDELGINTLGIYDFLLNEQSLDD
ncbi:MAG: ATP-binding protein [Bacteriovoracaceae bacterium]|nr:ATP-binding protein [Bacteriovoracaceae bacterium]